MASRLYQQSIQWAWDEWRQVNERDDAYDVLAVWRQWRLHRAPEGPLVTRTRFHGHHSGNHQERRTSAFQKTTVQPSGWVWVSVYDTPCTFRPCGSSRVIAPPLLPSATPSVTGTASVAPAASVPAETGHERFSRSAIRQRP